MKICNFSGLSGKLGKTVVFPLVGKTRKITFMEFVKGAIGSEFAVSFFRGKNVVRVHEITNEAVYSLPNGSFQIYNIFI